MTTIATQHHRKIPRVAAICLAGGLACAGIVGVAWHAASDSTAPEHSPVLRTGSQGSTEQGHSALGGVDGHVPPARPPVESGPRVQVGQ
jgi:hypothetical protein